MGFPNIYGGVLPLVVVNTAISLALVRNLVDALLRIVGLKKREELEPVVIEPPPWYAFHRPQEPPPSSSPSSSSVSDQLGPIFVEEIQSTLPMLEFGEIQSEELQCAVCLCDFESFHVVRKLPHCSHVFHRDCLDKWLNHNQTTCPMCRSSLLTDDLARRHRHQEEILAEELALWLSVYHTSALSRGPWWYRGHGSGFGSSWDFH